MKSKLTLSINAGTIERAKKWSKLNKTNISKTVENLLNQLMEDSATKPTLGPKAKKLLTLASGLSALDYKKGKEDFLVQKYLK